MTEAHRALVCAHRGASAVRPENTLAAYRTAIEMGADMIEGDVRRDAAGRLVMAHDPVPDPCPADAPLLADLVGLADGRIALDVELKEPGCEEDALQLLDHRPSGLIVTSFLPGVVARLAQLDPSLTTGLIVNDPAIDPLPAAARCGADVLVAEVSLVDERLLDAVLRCSRRLMVWTVNDLPTLSRLLHHRAVWAVATDVPDVAVRLR
jgi:glycerophosphoryl diester phosphodiesterase